jgi:hypothetical protein
MRFITLSLLALLMFGSVADADRYDRRDRGDRRDDRRDSYRRDNRSYNRPVVRNNYRRERYRGPVRANRRVIDRRPIYISGNSYRFHNGRQVVYNRPIIRQRYYDVRFRPQVVVENYPAQYGYIWVSGHWNWNGGEWQWVGGHYAPDPSISQYYDDDSYDVNVNVDVGGGY